MENKKVVLITEDEMTLRHILRDKLIAVGINVIEAKNGEEGLEIALREHPDLIIVDIIMPRMDGITMIQKLSEDEKGKNIKYIILTNVDSTEQVAEAMRISKMTENGSFEYLIKTNIKLEDVVKKIREKIGQ